MAILAAKVAIFVVSILLVMLIVLEGPGKDREWYTVRYKLIPKMFAVALFFLMAALLYSMTQATGVKTVVVAIVWLFFIFSIVMLLEVYRKKIWFDSKGVYSQEFYGKRTLLNAELINRKKKNSQGFKILDENNVEISCSFYMSGAHELENFVDSLLNTKS